MFARLERYRDVEGLAGDLAPSAQDDAGVLSVRGADPAFAGMGVQVPDRTRRRLSIGKQGARRADDLDLLKIAVRSGVEDRPGNGRSVWIDAAATVGVRLPVSA